MRLENKVRLVFGALSVVFLLISPTAATAAAPGEQELLDEINRVRAAHGAPPLRLDVRLDQAAKAHSRDMVRRGYFAHGNIARRLAAFGAQGPLVGENLGWGVGARGTARAIVAAWLASPTHRANLLRRGFRRVGVGRVVGTFARRGGATVVTANFAGR
jgi:uncharacterized protein YkwD